MHDRDAGRAVVDEFTLSDYLAGIAIRIFVGHWTAFRVLMVWVYNHAESLFRGMLMHASFTASLLVVTPSRLPGRASSPLCTADGV
jgi:hypothetical protein